MTCERCRERPARYVVTQVVPGQAVQQIHLCEQCAAEHGDLTPMPFVELPLQHLLAGLIGGIQPSVETEAPPDKDCPGCGYPYAEFVRTGLVGCAQCYEAFAGELEPAIRRMHGKARHEGKIPLRSGGDLRQRRTLAHLRQALAEAVAQEAFERAAELRDRIRALKSEADGAAAGGQGG